MLWFIGFTAAHAFCGTYVGQAGSTLYNESSEVAMVRQGTSTTLTLANDVVGDVSEFALLLPVPEVLEQDDVTLADAGLFTRLDAYSSPRLVSYECTDMMWDAMAADADGDDREGGSSPGDEALEDSVEVEARFGVGAYEIVILSAEESDDLLTWLDLNGYAISGNAEDLLQEYIDAGTFFMAAKVDLDQAPEDGALLSPLQIRYDADHIMLPIRLGTLNAVGDQDLIVYTVTDDSTGALAISNYPETAIEDECMWDDQGEGFGAYYKAVLSAALDPEEPSWVQEYSWSPGKCDPCASDPIAPEELAALGFSGAADTAHFTRLHMRYAPDAVDQDLVFYATNSAPQSQIRYIEHKAELESYYPVCGLGYVDNPGTCNDDVPDDRPKKGIRLVPGSCSHANGLGLGLWTVGLLLVGRRRRIQPRDGGQRG